MPVFPAANGAVRNAGTRHHATKAVAGRIADEIRSRIKSQRPQVFGHRPGGGELIDLGVGRLAEISRSAHE